MDWHKLTTQNCTELIRFQLDFYSWNFNGLTWVDDTKLYRINKITIRFYPWNFNGLTWVDDTKLDKINKITIRFLSMEL